MKENYNPYPSGGMVNGTDNPVTHFSSKTFWDFIKESDSPMVYCIITIDGKEFKGSFSVEITQHTNNHDSFTITTPDDNFDSFEGYVFENSKYLHGKDITLDFWRYGQKKQSFKGIIGKVSNRKNEGGGYGDLLITGYAPSILLESGKDCQSFEDKTLEQIISEICSEYPQEAKIKAETLNTKYNIPYTVQYKETDYQFIKRLAVLYGEYFYYNGENLVFGNKVQSTVKLGENIDLIDVEFELNIKPQDFGYISYDTVSGGSINKNSSQVQSQYKENPFQAILINSSKKIFKKKPQMHFGHTGISGRSERELEEAVRSERENRENLVLVKGRSKDPELKIGSLAEISDINSKAMETYRIIEIKHYHDGDTYYNEFTGIPDLFNPPYQNSDAVPLGEIQSARVTDNNDPMGAGRIRVQFPWQIEKNGQTPWIHLIQPHSGAGKGFHFIPEIGEEVLVGYESENAEKPFVMGTKYNGSETSGFHTAGNDLKVTKTRSGHSIILNDSEDKMSITILDQSGNTIYLDTVKKSITIKAPETINIICKNLNIDVEENMKTNVGHNQENTIGKNIKTVAKEEISQDSGKKTIIASGDNTEISARKDLDLYGKKNLIGFTDGKTEFGAKEQIHIYGASSLITAKDKIQYKAPQMNKIPESGKFKHDKEKQIINVKWMDAEMNEEISNANYGDKVSLLVQTRNYEEGEIITVIIDEENGNDVREGEKEITLTGTVNAEGFAELKEKVEIEKIKEDEKQNQSSQGTNNTNEDAIYKSYEGKDYTKSEWKNFEDEQYKIYLENKNKKGFWR